jgi:CubicO group peptidase (beta-lactamase class C family)
MIRIFRFVPILMASLLVGETVTGSQVAATGVHTPAGDRQLPITQLVRTSDPGDLALIQAVAAYIPMVMRARGTPGLNIALARRGEIVWEAGFGYADAKKEAKMTPETAFHSGSMGKTYTGTAIMQLVEQGTISLSDPINKYLPFKVTNPLGDREVTIQDLMTHRSGLGDDRALSVFTAPGPLRQELRDEYNRPADTFMGNLSPRWIAKAGVQYHYSNLGIATLGLIVETANPEHLSYSEYVEKHIMRPLGMKYAQYPPVQDREHIRPEIWSRMSTGYATMGRVWIPTATVYFGEFPCGGFVAAPADHLRLLLAMMNGGRFNGYQLLKPATVDQMLTPQSEQEGRASFRQGLIWMLFDLGKTNARFEHSGAHMYGWLNNAIAWPRLETAYVVALNEWSLPSHRGELQLIQDFIRRWVEQEHPAPVASEKRPENWAWKVSYLRGLLYVEAFNSGIGIPTRLADAEIVRIAGESVVDPAAVGVSWDPDGFIEGARAMNQVEPTAAGIQAFARSGRMKLTLEEAQRAFLELSPSGGMFASLGGLLKAPPNE